MKKTKCYIKCLMIIYMYVYSSESIGILDLHEFDK
jgi:hypothetical protein